MTSKTEAATSRINAAWHKANRMPLHATLDQRVAWHLAHWKACGCRTALPGSIVVELRRRGVKLPSKHHASGHGHGEGASS